MWTIFRTAGRLTALWLGVAGIAMMNEHSASAQFLDRDNVTYLNTQTITHGLFLPPVAIPNGADEVRASDGTTCRSSLASNQGYFDVGAIGNQDPERDTTNASVYGRFVLPLGQRPARLDRRALYRLEVERLRREIELVKMGANASFAQGPHSSNGTPQPWETEGWNDHRASDRGWVKGTTTTPE